jgi:hypothetical protein
LNIRPPRDDEIERVVASRLGLARLPRDDGSFYLVAWENGEPKRVTGTVQLRSSPLEVDDTLLTWQRELGVDFPAARSSLDDNSPKEGT